ncbi:nitrogenase-stabilizing/protective protein NifW [Sideroxyarcus emersonii]|uniref:Nitrogenase-stabilizing/protective protein NifW n=2 Tax=Sideroxyarcus emersonii TaxID=2764705 RepID=A0AAN2BYE8_9PROT|nr:nitrogenase-stabilizing/protective protein NifW [Sideroxyarcus emersonii]
MEELSLDEAMEELVSAEDFLNYFGIEYDPAVVHVNRLHILQRFHDYLGKTTLPEVEDGRRSIYTTLLRQAYLDFVKSDALTEKVFKVFHMHEPQVKFVPISSISVSKPK